MMSGGQWMVVMIVGIVMFASIIKRRYRAQDQDMQGFGATAPDDAETRRLRDEVRTLKERVQVLERVITDNHSSSSLDREIEKLRDQDRV